MATLLQAGQLELLGILSGASNHTFLAKLWAGSQGGLAGVDGRPAASRQDSGTGEQLVVYKPRRGETPLWDFPPGTLCRREVAACVVAEAGGWDFIPPTVLREGPLGMGAVQAYIEHDPSITAFGLVRTHRADLKRIALFDLVANNADRKAGHILLDPEGKLWSVDHGLCFHEEPKLRTVLWDFIGEPVSPEDLDLVLRLCSCLESGGPDDLERLLSPQEIDALWERARRVLDEKVYPPPETSRPYPWPPV